MLTRMRNTLRLLGGHARISTRPVLPNLSGAELAKSSWATRIETYADVPDLYKGFFEPFLAAGRAFPYTVLTPSHERFIHRQTEKLISDFGREIYVLERIGNTFHIQCYPVDKIVFVEYKTALLASSLRICGQAGDGALTSSTLLFNAVTDYLFAPLLKTMRPVPFEKAICEKPETEPFDHLVRVNYKFMNYARHSLLAGEWAIQSIFQPEIRERVLTVFGKRYFKLISPAHMMILSDQELISIREDTVRRKEDRYGGIWTYIPLRKVMSLAISETLPSLLVLSVSLAKDISFKFLFQASAEEELHELMDRLGELKNI